MQINTNYCRYHPLETAVWMHPQSHECYCPRCVDRDEEAEVPTAVSVIGGEPLQYLGSAGDAPLFWEQLNTYLVFPARWQVLMWWVPLLLVAGVLLASDGVTRWVGAGVALLGLSQIAYAVFRVTGDGQPLTVMNGGLNSAMMEIKPETLLGLLLAQVIPVALLVAANFYTTGIVTHVIFVSMVVLLPALMLVALVEQGSGLVSPQRWLDMINGVGWSYVLVVSFLVLVAGFNGIAISLFYGELPSSISLPILLAVLCYSMIVFYRMLGGVIHQFQHRIGYMPPGKVARKRTRQSLDRSDQTIDMLVKDARFDDLEHYLRQLIKQRPQAQRYQDLLGKLLLEKGDENALRQHADHMLETVIKADDNSRLLFIYNSQLALLKDYKPASPGVRFAVAQQLAEKGEHEAAARLLVNMHNEFPQYPSLGEAYWFLARLLAEELAQPDLAAQCAMFVYKTFPKHPEREAVEAFLIGWRQRREG